MTREERRIENLRRALLGYAGRPSHDGQKFEFKGEFYRGENARMALIDDSLEQQLCDFDKELIRCTGKSIKQHGFVDSEIDTFFTQAPTIQEQVTIFMKKYELNQE